MKRFVLLPALVALGFVATAQNAKTEDRARTVPLHVYPTAGNDTPHKTKITSHAGKDGEPIHFTETFANGTAGENGEWATGGAQGNLWFRALPLGTTNGYDPNAINDTAYTAMPGYFGSQTTIDSETKDNGFMMLDADAYNSERYTADDSISGTANPLEAYLISPSIDLTGLSDAAIVWSQKYRLCCANTALYVDISLDGGETWAVAWMDDYTAQNSVVENTIIHNFTELLNTASDLGDVKFRFRWPYADQNGEGETNTHYYWMIDDVYITDAPNNDLKVLKVFYNTWPMLEQGWLDGTVSDADYVPAFELDQIPDWLVGRLNFVAVVQNNGLATQTGVGIEATVLSSGSPEPGVIVTPAADRIDLAPGEIDTLTLLNQIPPDGAYYQGVNTVVIGAMQNETDEYPDDNQLTSGFTVGYESYSNGYAVTDAPGVSQDYIIGQRYSFGEIDLMYTPTSILGIEVVLNNTGQEGFITSESVLLFANIRKGSVFGDNPTTVVFGDDPLVYSPIESIFVTTATEFYTGGDNLVMARVYFTSAYGEPIAIPVEANTVYQAEIRVPALEGDQKVSVALQSNQEIGAVIMENPGDPDATWESFGSYAALIGFVLDDHAGPPIEVRDVTFQNGVEVFQNRPNPFRGESTFGFKLPKASKAYLEIGDMRGRVVRRVDLGVLLPGRTDHLLNAGDLSAGLYTYTLITDLGRITRKMAVE